MSDELFTDAEAGEAWVDVRMTDPEKGEWDVDFVVAGGRVEYVDLRVKPDHLAAFVDCLVDDVGTERAGRILSTVADRQDLEADLDPDPDPPDEPAGVEETEE